MGKWRRTICYPVVCIWTYSCRSYVLFCWHYTFQIRGGITGIDSMATAIPLLLVVQQSSYLHFHFLVYIMSACYLLWHIFEDTVCFIQPLNYLCTIQQQFLCYDVSDVIIMPRMLLHASSHHLVSGYVVCSISFTSVALLLCIALDLHMS